MELLTDILTVLGIIVVTLFVIYILLPNNKHK